MADAIWNNNYILSNTSPDAMYTSGLEYDVNDKISGYAGSAFAGGSEIQPAVSGYWQSASDTVSANSGAWGGSALPVSAGPGVKIGLQNDTLVFSTDETVLWSGAGSTTGSTINLNESLSHFEKYGLYYYIPYQESNQTYYQELVYKPGQTVFGIKTDGINSNIWRQYIDYGTMTDTSISLVSGRQGGAWLTATPQQITWYDGNDRHHYITKVIGINRIVG